MLHWHHIVPLHAGGTNDPSNFRQMTIPEHAEEHRLLYEQYGRKGDRLAWLALSGQISKEEIQKEKTALGIAATIARQTGRKQSPETIEKRARKLRGKKRSQNSIERIRQSQLGNTNCQGRKLSEETKNKIRQARLGTTQPQEAKEKISQSLLGNKRGLYNKNRLGKLHTEGTKQKMRHARKEFWNNREVKK